MVPGLTELLEDTLLNRTAGQFKDLFLSAMDLLIMLIKGMHAKGLESEAVRLLRCAKDDNLIASAKKNLKPFITEALSLSIAMQKAQKKDEEKKSSPLSKIEIYANLAKSISAVNNLIEDGFYAPAQILLKNIIEHHSDAAVFTNLLELLEAGKNDDVKVTIIDMIDKINKAISQMVGVDLTKKILAVDDMPEILSFVNNALKSNYRVIAVPGGMAALEVMETQKPDLFILDIDMPGIDGFMLAAKIRSMAEHKTTPIIFLTGNSSKEHINKATIAGGNEFIVKPATREYLLTKVGGFLNA
jgi:CheY-like chemotaxis protein